MTIRDAFTTKPEIQDKWDTAFEAFELLPNWKPESKKKKGQPTYYLLKDYKMRKKRKKSKWINSFDADHIVYVQEIKKGSLQCKLLRLNWNAIQTLNHFLVNKKFCRTSSCILVVHFRALTDSLRKQLLRLQLKRRLLQCCTQILLFSYNYAVWMRMKKTCNCRCKI